MPTREQVWASADHVQTTGERVTQKRVLDHLRAAEIGCTERTIDAHLIAWKATRSYNPRLAVLDLPGPLSTRLAGFMEGLWDAAMAEANARLEERRAYLEREREAAGQLLNETQIRAEETARENEALRARQVVKDTTTAALRAEVVALRKEVAHLRRSEFWDHVIREIAEILPEKDWMSIEEIVRRLPPSLAKEALVLDKALTPGRVNRQMFLRDHHSRFFEKKKKEALYRKRPGWTSITSPTGKRRNASASAEATAGVDNA
ncbi:MULTISPECIES: DNA-binding protein [Methylobacterium]|jgi:hypothetical protein|uniref:KfrA N-terminal DNA-binding domain-containing protein n=1 Tax=Methylobacterium oryzae TaxID=334852 RepID=A0ABU7TQX4_9HYPH